MLTIDQCKQLETAALAWVTTQSQYERFSAGKADVIKAAAAFDLLLKSLTEKPAELANKQEIEAQGLRNPYKQPGQISGEHTGYSQDDHLLAAMIGQ